MSEVHVFRWYNWYRWYKVVIINIFLYHFNIFRWYRWYNWIIKKTFGYN